MTKCMRDINMQLVQLVICLSTVNPGVKGLIEKALEVLAGLASKLRAESNEVNLETCDLDLKVRIVCVNNLK